MNDSKLSFEELVENYQTKIFHVANGMLCDMELARDITQDVFLKAFKAYDNFRHESSPETWLIRITINRVRDYFRREKLRRFLFVKNNEKSDFRLAQVADKGQLQPEELRQKQLKSSIKEFQNKLNGREKEVFGLRFGNDYTIKEISDYLKISQSSVKTYLYRALGKAQNHLADWRPL